jgi:hypothetical protein
VRIKNRSQIAPKPNASWHIDVSQILDTIILERNAPSRSGAMAMRLKLIGTHARMNHGYDSRDTVVPISFGFVAFIPIAI